MKTQEKIELTPLTPEELGKVWGGQQSGTNPVKTKVQGADSMIGELPIDSEP